MRPNRLLAGDHQHRHGAELGISRGRHQIGGAWAQRGKRYARFTGEPSHVAAIKPAACS